MAKRSRGRFTPGRAIVVRSSSPRPIIKVSAPRPVFARVKRGAARFASAAARHAYEEKHRLVACAAAAAVGYAEKEHWNIPHVEALGIPASWGLGLWLAQKAGFLRNKTVSHATTGLLAVASYKFGKGETVLTLSK